MCRNETEYGFRGCNPTRHTAGLAFIRWLPSYLVQADYAQKRYGSTKVKIREIRAAGLKGATPQGGWSSELEQQDCVHTLVAVLTDEGVTGVGSVFTNCDFVRAALGILEPLYRGENALEPERVSEKLHQNTF